MAEPGAKVDISLIMSNMNTFKIWEENNNLLRKFSSISSPYQKKNYFYRKLYIKDERR